MSIFVGNRILLTFYLFSILVVKASYDDVQDANVVRTRMTGKRKVIHTLLPSYGHVQDDREMVA